MPRFKMRGHVGLSALSIILIVVAIFLVVATIFVVLNLVDRSEQSVTKIKNTKIQPSKEGWSPSEKETITQIEYDLDKPNQKKAAYTDIHLSREAMKPIGKMTSLQSLQLTECTFSNESLSELTNLQLVVLDLQRTKTDDVGLAHVCKIRSLVRLDLADTNVTDEGMKFIGTLPDLGGLSLAETKVTTDGIKHLNQLKNLSNLNYVFHDLTLDGLNLILSMKKIDSLDLSRCRFTKEMLERIASASHLRYLALSDCDLHDDDLAIITRNRRITILAIKKNPFTPKGLALVEKMHLEQLEIADCKNLPESVVVQFEKRNPKCLVKRVRLDC